MRAIKFRVWNGYEMGTSLGIDGDGVQSYATLDLTDLTQYLETRSSILMQYTGLLDKNGKEIYEGDIVKSISHIPQNHQVEFIEGGFCTTHPTLKGFPIDINHFYPSIGTDLEVIGNIYENPELISNK